MEAPIVAAEALRRGRFSEPGRAYLVTTVTADRRPLFTNLDLARCVIREMRSLDQQRYVHSITFCLMPDHLHWIFVLGTIAPLSHVVRLFKGRTSRQLSARSDLRGTVWQPGFHDHAVRQEEDLRALARYVVANPLRAGLVNRLADYPHWDAVWIQSDNGDVMRTTMAD